MTNNGDSPCGRSRYARAIALRLWEAGHTTLFAGGYVRDTLLGMPTADIDIATSATPDEIGRLFRRTIPVGVRFGVVIVVKGGIPFEVATFRRDVGTLDGRHPATVEFADARADALRRDFTINGMFLDPRTGDILDYVDGERDLRSGMVRAIGDPAQRFEEDWLRLLRAVRFAARFRFAFDEGTWSALCTRAEGIERISAERIFQELTKMLCGPHSDRALVLLHESGLLARVLPEVEATVGVEQPPQFHPEGDVFTHTVLVLSHLDAPGAALAWAALLHDIGKPATMTRSDRIRFNNHHRVGARMAAALLKRLRAPNALVGDVCAIIDNHMNFANVTRMRTSTLKGFLARSTLEPELELHRADCLASHGDLDNYYYVKKRGGEFRQEQLQPVPFLRGSDLLELGLAPGPRLGAILQEARELQLDEQLNDREQALCWVRKRVAGDSGGGPGGCLTTKEI